jgi:DNA repair exonuclease SbcCD ATPase subunit
LAGGAQQTRLTLIQKQARLRVLHLDLATAQATVRWHQGQPQATELLTTAESQQGRLQTLRRVQDKHLTVNTETAKVSDVLTRTEGAADAMNRLATAEATRLYISKLQTLKTNLERMRDTYRTQKRIFVTAQTKEGAFTPLQTATELRTKLNTAKAIQTRFRTLMNTMNQQGQVIRNARQNLVQATTDYSQALQELGVCPTCLQPINEHTVAQITAEMQGETTYVRGALA